MLNETILVGRLTRDVELKYLDNGTPVGKFGLAVDGYKDKTNFFDIQVWGKTAEHCAEYIGKGRLVGLAGELKQERWEKDGQKRSKVIVNARNVKFLDYKNDSKPVGDTSNKQESDVEKDGQDFEVPF